MEIELKFRMPPEAAEQVLQHPVLQGPEHSARLHSVYFDTPGRDLQRCGLGLRVRDTGDGFVQTVKRDDGSGGIARGEWEAKIPGESVDADALEGTPAAGVLDGRFRSLEPVFSTTVERTMRMRRENGSLIEVSVDAGEVSSGDRREPISEIELELKEGEPGALFELGRRLVRETPLRLSFQSKAERGYRLAEETTHEPREAASPTLPAQAGAAEAFRSIALACLAQAVANAELLEAVRRPEAVHQMRVGLRRLRAALTAFKPMLGDDERDGVEGELKWLAGELDAARDLDVFIHGVFRSVARESGEDGLAAVGRRLLEAQTRAYDQALAAVKSERYAALVLETAAWIEAGAWTRTGDPVVASLRSRPAADFAAGALDHLRKVVRRRGRGFERLDPVSRHKLRIRAKRLRYATEFFDPLFPGGGKPKRAFLKALKRLQSCLGELNDIQVARSRVVAQAGLDDCEIAFAAGRMIGRREADEPGLLAGAAAAFEDFDAAAPFWK